MKIALVFAAVAAAISIGMAPPAHALSDQQQKFVTDVVNHGGPSMDQMITPAVMETGKTLGDVVCANLFQGEAGADEVIGVANDFSVVNGSMSQAEVIVYWAITDLCPDQMSQRQDQWRDGQ